jgi:DNA-binding IclR family transcriptional regulator
MLTYLTSPDMVSARLLDSDWDATSVLDAVALADPPFNALIDTGALVTGMSNLEGNGRVYVRWAARWQIRRAVYVACQWQQANHVVADGS